MAHTDDEPKVAGSACGCNLLGGRDSLFDPHDYPKPDEQGTVSNALMFPYQAFSLYHIVD
jgi:hypothetical protein